MADPQPAPAGASEAALDGNRSRVLQPHGNAPREFPASTEVVYVNGITTDFAAETHTGQRYADAIGGPVRLIHAATKGAAADIEITALEKLGHAANPPEAAVVAQVLEHVRGTRFEGQVHFIAHSRGALIVQRGLEQLEDTLHHRGFTPAQIGDVMAHVSVETAGGASLGMPWGVRCVNYVNPHDSVANVLGQGEPTLKDVAVLNAMGGAVGAVTAGVLPELGTDAYLLLKPSMTRPNGPVVHVPLAPPQPGALGDLYANHGIANYLAHRQPFEATYEAWRTRQHAQLEPAHAATAEAKAAEAAYATGLASPEPRSQLASLVQSRVDALARQGTPLPRVAEVRPWENRLAVGTFVQLDERTVSQHVGRGVYTVADVERDLGGRMPPLGRPVELTANGVVTDRAAAREAPRALG